MKRILSVTAGALLLLTLGAAAGLAPGHPAVSVAQEPTSPCSTFAGVDRNGPRDPALAGLLEVSVTVASKDDPGAGVGQGPRKVDEVTFSWKTPPWQGRADCIFIYLADPSIPRGRVPGDARSFTFEPTVDDTGDLRPKDVCYRLTPVSANGYGDSTEVCVFVTNPKIPPGRLPGVSDSTPPPGPPDAGSGVRVPGPGGGIVPAGFALIAAAVALGLLARRARR